MNVTEDELINFNSKIKILKKNKTKNRINKQIKRVIIIIMTLILIFIFIKIKITNNKNYNNLNKIKNKDNKDLNNSLSLVKDKKQNDNFYNKLRNHKFLIVQRRGCPECGLASDYITFLGALKKYIPLGYTPIFDLQTYNNTIRGNNISLNPWELYFEQPYGFKLNDIIKLKNISTIRNPIILNPYNDPNWNKKGLNTYIKYSKYIQVKKNIIEEAELIMKNILGESKNGICAYIRGTDITKTRPHGHFIPPTPEIVINDIKNFNKTVDWIFLVTEDSSIQEKVVNEFGSKVKYIQEKPIDLKENRININKDVFGNQERLKNYVIKMIILTKCPNLLLSKTSLTFMVGFLSEGFKDINVKIYDFGRYP